MKTNKKSDNKLSEIGKRWIRLYNMEDNAEKSINSSSSLSLKDIERLYKNINKWIEKRSELECSLTDLDKELISDEFGCPMFDY